MAGGQLIPLEVGEHQDAEGLGAGGLGERVEVPLQPALELVGPHRPEATPWNRHPVPGVPTDGNEIGRHDAGGARVGRWRPWILSRMRSAER